MGFNSIMKAFSPKDRVFYNIFDQIGENLIDMAKVLVEALKCTSIQERNELLKKLEQLEHANDNYTHSVSTALSKNFITPFDREDIHQLSKSLDDIADYIHSSGNRIVLYNMSATDEYMTQFAEIIQQAVKSLNKAIRELRSLKNLNKVAKACIKVNELEGKADMLFNKAMADLFNSGKDALEVMKHKDIYEDLEMVTDMCEDATDVIEAIVIKYS